MACYLSAIVLMLASAIVAGRIGWLLGTRELFARSFDDFESPFPRPVPVALAVARRKAGRALRSAFYAFMAGIAAGTLTVATLPAGAFQ